MHYDTQKTVILPLSHLYWFIAQSVLGVHQESRLSVVSLSSLLPYGTLRLLYLCDPFNFGSNSQSKGPPVFTA